jgi:hypothetical protein
MGTVGYAASRGWSDATVAASSCQLARACARALFFPLPLLFRVDFLALSAPPC